MIHVEPNTGITEIVRSPYEIWMERQLASQDHARLLRESARAMEATCELLRRAHVEPNQPVRVTEEVLREDAALEGDRVLRQALLRLNQHSVNVRLQHITSEHRAVFDQL